MEKQKARKHNKDVYLLGIDKYGDVLWMEAPSWDCGWYWGFGYVEGYTNGSHTSHSHFNGLVFRKDDKTNEYIYHINEALQETTLTENEAWQLSDLMKRFYTLKESAEIFGRGNAHMTSATSYDSTNKDIATYINEVELPNIFKAVIELLKP